MCAGGKGKRGEGAWSGWDTVRDGPVTGRRILQSSIDNTRRARLYWIGTQYPYLKSKWEKSVLGRNWLQLCPPAMPLGNTHWGKCNVCVRRFNLYCSLAIVIRCIIALKSNLPFESAA